MNTLEHYLNFATANESPKIYHLWSGLSLISHTIGRRVWTDMTKFKVYANMYVYLVGEAGIAKSTAMMDAQEAFTKTFPNIITAPGSVTKEAIVQMMAEEPSLKSPYTCKQSFFHNNVQINFSQLSVFADELIILLNAGGNLPGMIDFLTGIFGVDSFRDKTKNKGDYTVRNPFLNILGCVTTEKMKEMVELKLVTGGLARRSLFIHAVKNERPVPKIFYSDSQKESKALLPKLLNKIQTTVGEFTWTSQADEFYTKWYVENFYRIEATSSEALRTFLRTKPVYCIKVSMLLALCDETGPKLVHTLDTFKTAVDYVTRVERGASDLFDGRGRNDLSFLTDRVVHWMKSMKRPVHTKEAVQHFWHDLAGGDSREMDKVIEHLINGGVVELVKDSKFSGVLLLQLKQEPIEEQK